MHPKPVLKAYEVSIYGETWGLWVAPGRSQAHARCVAHALDLGHRIGHYVGGVFRQLPLFAGLRSRRAHGLPAERAIERYEDAGKYWRDTRAFARQQAAADTFNACWPVGTPVQIVNCGEAGQWPDGITWTRTPAWVPNETCCLVSVEGQAGGMHLQHVVPLVEPQPCL